MAEEKYPEKDVLSIDYASVLERVGGDASFLETLLDLYFEDFPEKCEQLQKAIEQKEFDLILKLGHGLKGSSSTLSLTFLQEASFHMETAGREKNIEKAIKALIHLEEGFKKLKDFLSKKEGQAHQQR